MEKYNEVGKPARETTSQEIIKFASRLAEMSDNVASRVRSKLAAVMLPDRPTIEVDEKIAPPREYPPLFDELNNLMRTIEKSLYSIENTISKTDI